MLCISDAGSTWPALFRRNLVDLAAAALAVGVQWLDRRQSLVDLARAWPHLRALADHHVRDRRPGRHRGL